MVRRAIETAHKHGLLMTLEKPIICLGIAVADLLGGPVRKLPERGRLELVDWMGLFTGGCAVNTATALARRP